MVASARTSATQHTCEVAGAIAQQRHGLAVEGGEHQFADFAIGHRLQSFWIDNLDDIVVFPEVEAVLFLTLKAYTRAAHLAHTKRVVCFHAHHLLDALTLFLRVWFGSDGQHLEFCVATRIDAFLLHHLVQTCHITRHGMYGCGSEVFDKLNLTERVSSSSRYGECSEAFGSVLETESAGEHAVAR